MLFSIIIPAYNSENFINYCLDSIFRQDFPKDDYEVIVIDDASPDNQNQIINNYLHKYNNLKLLKHTINKRQGGARNTGLHEAKGEYIIYLDSDDYWNSRDVLRTFKNIIDNNPNADIYESSEYRDVNKYELYDDSELNIFPIKIFSAEEYYTNKHHPCICTSCYKTKYISKFKFREKVLYEDTDWKIRVFTNAQKIVLFKFPFYCYYHNSQSSTHLFTINMFIDLLESSILCKNIMENCNLSDSLKSHIIKSNKKAYPKLVFYIRNYNIKDAYYLMNKINSSTLFENYKCFFNLKDYIFSFFVRKLPLFTTLIILIMVKIKRFFINLLK